MKKFLLMTTLFLCINNTIFASDYIFNNETIPATSSYRDIYYGVETIKNILDDLEIEYDETTLLSYTYYANQALKFWRATYDENTTALNICFTKNINNKLYMIPSNGSFDDDLNYMYIDPNYASKSGGIYAFNSWNYNTSGSISSANKTAINIINLETNNYSITNSIPDFTKNSEYDTQTGSQLYFKYLLSPKKTFTVAGKTTKTGYSWYYLSNTIRFTKEITVETTSGDENEDKDNENNNSTNDSTNLTITNEKIDRLNQHAEEILNKMLNSGDIEQSTQTGIIKGNNEFGGSSGDISGDEQKELITSKIDELTESLSGDLAKNEIFEILQKYENKIFGSFIGEEDFKIEWKDVTYMETVLIPKGEINFSQMCRENEILGKVKTTINIILQFFLLSNCVKYLYNLLLATLGIDNPYLYEKQDEEVNTVTYDTDINSGITTEIRTLKTKEGTTFKTRRKF